MNNKSLKYILLIAAILVWGLVIRSIIKGMSDGNEIKPTASLNLGNIDYNIKADSFLLFTDYADPFIPEVDSLEEKLDSISKQLKSSVNNNYNITNLPITNVEKPAPTDVSFINYLGMIQNTSLKNKKAGFITIHGKDYMIKEGQKIENITIKKIKKNELVISYNKLSFSIKNTK